MVTGWERLVRRFRCVVCRRRGRSSCRTEPGVEAGGLRAVLLIPMKELSDKDVGGGRGIGRRPMYIFG